MQKHQVVQHLVAGAFGFGDEFRQLAEVTLDAALPIFDAYIEADNDIQRSHRCLLREVREAHLWAERACPRLSVWRRRQRLTGRSQLQDEWNHAPVFMSGFHVVNAQNLCEFFELSLEALL